MIEKLIQLSKIFKEGFTIEVNNGVISQYNDISKPYVLSYRTILTIHNDTKKLHSVIIPDKCIIGGWFDTDTNTYYIELNKVYKNKRYALKIAKKYSQKLSTIAIKESLYLYNHIPKYILHHSIVQHHIIKQGFNVDTVNLKDSWYYDMEKRVIVREHD